MWIGRQDREVARSDLPAVQVRERRQAQLRAARVAAGRRRLGGGSCRLGLRYCERLLVAGEDRPRI